jgi:hypothetical protein
MSIRTDEAHNLTYRDKSNGYVTSYINLFNKSQIIDFISNVKQYEISVNGISFDVNDKEITITTLHISEITVLYWENECQLELSLSDYNNTNVGKAFHRLLSSNIINRLVFKMQSFNLKFDKPLDELSIWNECYLDDNDRNVDHYSYEYLEPIDFEYLQMILKLNGSEIREINIKAI